MGEIGTSKLQPGSNGKAILGYSSSQKKKRELDTIAEKAHLFPMVFQEPLVSMGEAAAETVEDLCI